MELKSIDAVARVALTGTPLQVRVIITPRMAAAAASPEGMLPRAVPALLKHRVSYILYFTNTTRVFIACNIYGNDYFFIFHYYAMIATYSLSAEDTLPTADSRSCQQLPPRLPVRRTQWRESRLQPLTSSAHPILRDVPLAVQNNIGELFHVLAFLDPEKFAGGIEEVEERYAHLAEGEKVCNASMQWLRPKCILPDKCAGGIGEAEQKYSHLAKGSRACNRTDF